MTKKQRKNLIKIIASIILMAICLSLPLKGKLEFVFFMIPYLVIGCDILIKALKGIFRGQGFDENFLMAVATIGAIALGDYVEGTAVMLFYQIGELFQSLAVGKSRKNIKELMDISPSYANLEQTNGDITIVDPTEVVVGSVIVIKVGERVPIDGVLVEGETSLDTSALTGESMPRQAIIGEEVVSGCINLSNVIKIRTTKKYEDSTVAKILDLIENSTSRKSHSEKFISKFAKYYTPVVCLSALILATIVPITFWLLSGILAFEIWIYRALTFLVISCPCALVISIPLTFFSTVGGAGKLGVLIKGSNYIETLSKTSCVVFDKTGTLTKGGFEVTKIVANNLEEDDLLEYAALCELYSNHPISLSIRNACKMKLDATRVANVKEFSGLGITSIIDNKIVCIGNAKLMNSIGLDVEAENDDCSTLVYVAIDNVYAGKIYISDEIKPNAKRSICNLREIGVKNTAMLTGDSFGVADRVSRELALDDFFAGLMPADKVSILESILAEIGKKEKLVYVGDGINDAPVLARADVGVAMGAMGSSSAIEAADVVLMDDDPLKLVKAIKLAKKCMAIVYQNIYFAIGVKLIFLILGAFGIANMWSAIFADVGVMVIAILNAVRALNVKNL